ncbi:MAG TPA: hypothetical protein VN678_12570 [Acidobacteriaceae bacterium]|nr:hypothetical protein [Acidobacteriaceae bacterium]
MGTFPRLRTVVAAIAASAGLFAVTLAAQAAPEPDSRTPPGILESLNNLAEQPATHTGFSFDRSELSLAQDVLSQAGLPPDRAAAALTGLSFDTYRYKEPAFYTPETMNWIVDTLHRAGWKHLVNGNQTPANEAQPRSTITDVWLHFSGADIDHVMVLVRATHEMSLVQVAGELRPLDLVHLSGHFGIPKVDPNAVMVPSPNGR